MNTHFDLFRISAHSFILLWNIHGISYHLYYKGCKQSLPQQPLFFPHYSVINEKNAACIVTKNKKQHTKNTNSSVLNNFLAQKKKKTLK